MLKIIQGGVQAVVEDWPGRLGYMGAGMAPAGAMDNVALEFGNLLVGNEKAKPASKSRSVCSTHSLKRIQ